LFYRLKQKNHKKHHFPYLRYFQIGSEPAHPSSEAGQLGSKPAHPSSEAGQPNSEGGRPAYEGIPKRKTAK